ncbi:hypothetical protein [uncultured Eubacterium sp.]|uniref:hypothetical protein n=1 Tax=uncultured Eubacterium sp. TaxID=165185 RepID=UPI0015B34D7A|nr:hypothetical protein [uncultured Eubacterium sp.]
MKVFLIVLAVIVLLIVFILSLSAEATVVYDGGWKTTVQVLFIKKDVELSKILNFVLFPDKAGKAAAEKSNKKKNKPPKKKDSLSTESTPKADNKAEKCDDEIIVEADIKNNNDNSNNAESQQKSPNMITKIIDEDGIVGIMTLVSNLIETLNTAVTTLFKGLHIYSLYVSILVGGADAAEIATAYGKICGVYYPVKGMILNGMKVDRYDDYIQPDFIAERNEYEFQLIASMSVGLVLKIGIKAGFTFLLNLIKNKNS